MKNSKSTRLKLIQAGPQTLRMLPVLLKAILNKTPPKHGILRYQIFASEHNPCIAARSNLPKHAPINSRLKTRTRQADSKGRKLKTFWQNPKFNNTWAMIKNPCDIPLHKLISKDFGHNKGFWSLLT